MPLAACATRRPGGIVSRRGMDYEAQLQWAEISNVTCVNTLGSMETGYPSFGAHVICGF